MCNNRHCCSKWRCSVDAIQECSCTGIRLKHTTLVCLHMLLNLCHRPSSVMLSKQPTAPRQHHHSSARSTLTVIMVSREAQAAEEAQAGSKAAGDEYLQHSLGEYTDSAASESSTNVLEGLLHASQYSQYSQASGSSSAFTHASPSRSVQLIHSPHATRPTLVPPAASNQIEAWSGPS